MLVLSLSPYHTEIEKSLPNLLASPKSMSLILVPVLLTHIIFSGFKSKCTIPCLWMYWTPSEICLIYLMHSLSVSSKSSSIIRSKSSPPETLGKTEKRGLLYHFHFESNQTISFTQIQVFQACSSHSRIQSTFFDVIILYRSATCTWLSIACNVVVTPLMCPCHHSRLQTDISHCFLPFYAPLLHKCR